MAVFTQISEDQLTSLLKNYSIGELLSLKPVGQGIENSNYFLTTQTPKGAQVKWVVTIFETLSAQELPFFFNLTQTLSASGLPVPAAQVDAQHQALQHLAGKPLAIFPCFSGDWLRSPDEQARSQVAKFIAAMHQATTDFADKRSQVRDRTWIEQQIEALKGHLPDKDLHLLLPLNEFLKAQEFALSQLPKGIVHGDLFRDNVLFDQGHLSGVIDFYHACEDIRLFDLAVAINDWCAKDDGALDWTRVEHMIAVYQAKIPFDAAEQQHWPSVMLLAAMRFWLSRLVSRYQEGYQREAMQGDITKEPDELYRKLQSINKRYQLF